MRISIVGKLLPCFLAVSILLSGCSTSSVAEEIDETVEEKTVPVEVLVAAKGAVKSELNYAGQVKAKETVNVFGSGKFAKVYYDVGDRVYKDGILFELDSESVQDSIRALEAQYNVSLRAVDSARSALATATGGSTESSELQLETAVKNSEIAVNNAKDSLNNITDSYEKTKRLFEEGITSKNDFDSIELAYNQATLAYEQTLTQLQQAKSSYEIYMNKTKGETANQAQSGLDQAMASANATLVQLENARKNLTDLRIESPITGVITARNAVEGGMASASSPAFTVIDMDTVTVNVSVSEELINKIEVGYEVDIVIGAISNERITGKISTVSPAADQITNTYPVTIEIQNSDGIIKPGMFAQVYFIKEESAGAFILPRNTVIDEESGRYVYINDNGAAKRVSVTTGIDNGQEIEILTGLNEGDKVIVKGHKSLAEGEKLHVVNNGGADLGED